MKKYILLGVLVLSSINMKAQGITEHILQVGESEIIGYSTNAEFVSDGAVCGFFYSTGKTITVKALAPGRAYIRVYNTYGTTSTIHAIHVVGVKTISIIDHVDLTIDESFTYEPVITDKEATTTLTWTSSNSEVATVDNSGKVTALAEGYATIKCKAANGVFTQSIVNVSPVLANDVRIMLFDSDITGEVTTIWGSMNLEAQILPANATSQVVKWNSSNENVAIVDGNGRLTSTGPGYCTVTASAYDGSGKYGSCIIHVEGGGVTSYGTQAYSSAEGVFDVQGRQLQAPRKGTVNIIDGNKVYVK